MSWASTWSCATICASQHTLLKDVGTLLWDELLSSFSSRSNCDWTDWTNPLKDFGTLTWLEVWWSLGSYQSMFHHAMRGDTLSHSIETIYDLWWSFGLTHPCSTTLWAPDHSTSIILRQCKDKGHISHPQEKPQATSTGGRGGRGSRWVHYIGGGGGGACQTWIIYMYCKW